MTETVADDDQIDCLTCMDTGEYIPYESDVLMPCPVCIRGMWNNHTELSDEMRREESA